jgi:hypothetical protein
VLLLLHDDPNSLSLYCAQVLAEIEDQKAGCQELLDLLADADAVAALYDAGNFTYEYLEEHHGLTEDKLDAYYR